MFSACNYTPVEGNVSLKLFFLSLNTVYLMKQLNSFLHELTSMKCTSINTGGSVQHQCKATTASLIHTKNTGK